MNMMLPSGFVVKMGKNTSGEWDWSIHCFGKHIQSGHTKTEKEATSALKTALGETLVNAAVIRNGKGVLKLKLRSWVERRPYIAMHVFSRAMEGMGPKEIIRTAADEERELHRLETERCGSVIPPLSTHHLTKPAPDVAAAIVELIRGLGWKKPQLKAYSEKMFGPAGAAGLSVDDVVDLAAAKANGKP